MALKIRMFKMVTIRCNRRFVKSDNGNVKGHIDYDNFNYGVERFKLFDSIKEVTSTTLETLL